MSLSIVIATRNEEENIKRCIDSVQDIADEIIVVDEYSKDKTRAIAQSLGARVYLERHNDNFHVTKQKALQKAKGEWILQLDADEEVTTDLKSEINSVVQGTHSPRLTDLFVRHQRLIEKRDGKIGDENSEIVGYFIPRRNLFLGRALTHAGVYPDGVIRLVKNGYASFPQKSVHEQIQLKGKVSWLSNPLNHYDSPTLKKYFMRFNRYTDLQVTELKLKKTKKNLFVFLEFIIIKPLFIFLNLYFRHLGFIDGVPGFLWSFLSALHYPIAYIKFWIDNS